MLAIFFFNCFYMYVSRPSSSAAVQFVFAAGTGRCGTGSLAALLRVQGNGTHVTHEGGRILPWLAAPDDRVTFALWLLEDVLRARGTHRDPLQSTYPLCRHSSLGWWWLPSSAPRLHLFFFCLFVCLNRTPSAVSHPPSGRRRRLLLEPALPGPDSAAGAVCAGGGLAASAGRGG